MKKPSLAKDEPELYPDAWSRFRQAVHVMTKAGPQHRISGSIVKSGPKSAKEHAKGAPSKKPSKAKGL